MMTIDIKRFDPHAADGQEWRALHAYRRSRAQEDQPGEPVEADDEFEHALRRHWPLYDAKRWLAWNAGVIVGLIGLGFRRPESPHYDEHAPYVDVWGGVSAACRRQGIATRLLQQLAAFMADNGKIIATLYSRQPDGQAFLAAIGADLKHRGVENRLLLGGLDWDELDRWQVRAIPAASGLSWEIHAGRVPAGRFEEILPQFNELFQDVPLGDLDVPPIRWEMASFRTHYEELDRHGGAHYVVLLMSGDRIAALCEASFDARYPDRVHQMLTAVARPWRGQGLAKAVKAAMLKLIRERHPDVSLMITGNAQTNAAMLTINRQLGFTEYRRDATYQIGPEALAAYLATRPAMS